MRTIIYGLFDEHNAVRYIGKTETELSGRLYDHIARSHKRRTHKDNWIMSMNFKGLTPTIAAINIFDGDGRYEEIGYIAYYKRIGANLTNGTEGGDGASGHIHSIETRAKISRSLTGKRLSEETRKKMSASKIGCKHPRYGKHHTKEAKEKISLGLTGKTPSDETKKKLSLANTGKPGFWKGKRRSEESRKRMSIATTLSWKNRNNSKN